MRVCMVIPPSAFLLDDRVFVSLGILRVAAVLEQKGVNLDLLDLSGNKDYMKAVESYRDDVDVFGITATTPQLQSAVVIARYLRKKGKKVILGGPHVSLVNAAHKKIGSRATKALAELHEDFDVLVAGDGEVAILDAIDGHGLIDADIPKTGYFLTNDQLNEMPLPARHLADLSSYHYEIDGVNATSLMAQLGCPFECGFCGGRSSMFLRKIRTRSTERVIDELRFLYQTYGYRGFMFHDDEMNVNKNVLSLMEQMKGLQDELRTTFACRGFLKAELLTEDVAEAMSVAGFKQVLVGFESGSPRILKNIKKHATRDQNTRCVEICKKYGLKVKALMSIGHPGESQESVQETRDWLREVRPDDFDVTIIAVYPGTSYYDEAVETEHGWTYTVNGDRLHSEEIDCRTTDNYYKGAPNAYKAFVHTDHLTAQDLIRLRYETETMFGKVIPTRAT